MIRKYNHDALNRVKPFMDRILSILPEAVIAGGFVRDTLLDKPTRDVDVFIGYEPSPDQLQTLGRFLADDPGLMVKHDPGTLPTDYEPDPTRSTKVDGLWQGGGIDVIVTSDVATHLMEFPDNISRVYYDSNGLHMGFGFSEGHDTKTITYKDRAGPNRLLKLIAKYPNYRVNHE